jgi:hypothetical protein
MITQTVKLKAGSVTPCPPMSVKERQDNVEFRLFKTIPSESEIMSSVMILTVRYEGKHKMKTKEFYVHAAS